MKHNGEHKQSRLTRNAVVEISLFLIALIAASLLLWSKGGFAAPDRLAYKQLTTTTPFGEISASYSMLQEIPVESEQTLTRLSVQMATYGRENHCQVVFMLYLNDELIRSETADAAEIADGGYYTLRNIGVLVTPEDSLYLFITSPDGAPGNAVTVWTDSGSADGGLYAYDTVNGTAQKIEGTAVLSVKASSGKDVSISRIVSFICLFTLAALLLDKFVRWLTRPREKRHKVIQSKRERHETLFYKVLFFLIAAQMIWRFLYGFRWPSEYAQTQTVFTYEDGFLPRAFVGSILNAAVSDLMYNKVFLTLFILSIGLVLLFLLINSTYYFSVKTHNLIGCAVMLWFSLSIYDAFLAHEMGYFEQYGYVLVFVLLLLFDKIRSDAVFIVCATASIWVSLLISETNAFLICPLLVSICLFRIVLHPKKEHQTIKNVALLLLLNIPSLIYCYIAGTFNASDEQVLNQIVRIKSSTINFQGVEGVGGYFHEANRLNNDYTGAIHFNANPWQLMAYMLLIVFTVALMLLLGKKYKEMLLFIGTSAFVIGGAYFTNFVGWDTNRWEFAQAMGVTLLAVCALRHTYVREAARTKDILYTLVIGTMIMISVMDYKMILFDSSVYNDSLSQMDKIYQAVADFIRMNIS